MFIVRLLQGDPSLTPKQLYEFLSKKGNKDRNTEGGLGKAFNPKKRWDIVSKAFTINDQQKTAVVKDIEALYRLADLFKKGTPPATAPNLNKYVICLALIVFLDKPISKDDKSVKSNSTFTSTALDKLAEVYKKNGDLKDVCIKHLNITISEFIEKKRVAYTDKLGASAVSRLRISRMTNQNFKKHSRHHFTFVTLNNLSPVCSESKDFKGDLKAHPKKEPERNFIQKRDVLRRIANFEAYSGTLMELYNGPNQPTFFVVKSLRSHTDVLSEKLDFTTFANPQTLTAWAKEGYPGAAEINIGCIDIAENDDHLNNSGKRKDNGAAVRIDFDQSFGERTFLVTNPENNRHLKIQRVNNKKYWLGKLTWVQGYNFHEDDLTNLPLLPNVTTNSFPESEWSEHYAPTNWWTFSDVLPLNIQSELKDLPRKEIYLEPKFRSMLEKIILPQEIYDIIAGHIPFDEEDAKFVMEFRAKRRARWRDKSAKTTGFIPFVLQNGEVALVELKNRLLKFMDKRKDIFNPAEVKRNNKIMAQYDLNFREYIATLRKPTLDEKKSEDKKSHDQKMVMVSPEHPRQEAIKMILHPLIDPITNLLIKMNKEGLSKNLLTRKKIQSSFFIDEINKLSLENLKSLNDLMNKVQFGLVQEDYFNIIRTERINYLGDGNTTTWCVMRKAVKTAILDQLKKYNIDLTADYLNYVGLFNQHSGRYYSRWGKTNTLKEFTEVFPEEKFLPLKKLN